MAPFAFPPVAPALSLAELFGPAAVLALAAVGVTLGVVIVGLALDMRDGRRRPARPIVIGTRRSTRRAA